MSVKGRVLALLLGASILTACGSGGSSTGSAVTSSASTPQPLNSAPPTKFVGPARSSGSSGAAAAPEAAANYAGTYDASHEAVVRFGQWWEYEAQVPEDQSRDIKTVYNHGVTVVCAGLALGRTGETIRNYLDNDAGYTPSGAAAVYAAALRALCWKYDVGHPADNRIGGYQTYFVELVAKAYYKIAGGPTPLLTYSISLPRVYEFGWLGKLVCGYIAAGRDLNYLLQFLYENNQNMPNVMNPASGDRVGRITVWHTVEAVCYAYTDPKFMGPIWSSGQ
jgi:hypothetical protein